MDALGDQLAAAPPRRHLHEQPECDQQREPAAVGDLWDVGGEEGDVDDQRAGATTSVPWPSTNPTVAGHDGEEDAS